MAVPAAAQFIPLPLAGDSVLGPTLFDRQLPTYLGLPLPAEDSGQVVITSGDMLLGFQANEVRLASTGMTGLACTATAEQASRHGVYCLAPDGRVRQFLQKPSPAQQAEHKAADAFGRAMLDIGVIHFDAATAIRLLSLCRPQVGTNGKLAFSGSLTSAILREEDWIFIGKFAVPLEPIRLWIAIAPPCAKADHAWMTICWRRSFTRFPASPIGPTCSAGVTSSTLARRGR